MTLPSPFSHRFAVLPLIVATARAFVHGHTALYDGSLINRTKK